MTVLYSRVAKVIVGTKLFENFRMSFQVVRTADSTPNSCKVSIYGLKEGSRSIISSEKKPPLLVEAGYAEGSGVIFLGEAVRPIHEKGQEGWITTVEGLDGASAGQRIINKSFGPGAKPGDIIKAIAEKMGISAASALKKAAKGDFDGAIGAFSNGITLSGNSKKEMDKLAATIGFDWSIQNGELIIAKASDFAKTTTVRLTENTGLIGAPQKIKDTKRPGATLVKFSALLQPLIEPKKKLQLESNEISGVFRPERVTHTGDTHGDNWFTEVEAREV